MAKQVKGKIPEHLREYVYPYYVNVLDENGHQVYHENCSDKKEVAGIIEHYSTYAGHVVLVYSLDKAIETESFTQQKTYNLR